MRARLVLGFAFCLVTASLFAPGCRRDGTSITESKTVTAAFVPAGYYLPFLVMENDGLLEELGYALKLNKFLDNTEMINTFLNGGLDVTAQSGFTMFPIAERHPGTFRFIYAQYNNSYFFVVPKDSSISSLKDLKGRNIGTWKSPTAVNFIRLILETVNLKYDPQNDPDDNDFHITRFGAGDLLFAMENQQCEVLFGFDVPVATLVHSGKFRYLVPDAVARLIPGDEPDARRVFNGGAFIHSNLMSRDPRKAAAIKQALYKALEVIRREPDRARTILAKRLNADENVVKVARLDYFTWPNSSVVESAEKIVALLKRKDIIKGTLPPIDSMFWLP